MPRRGDDEGGPESLLGRWPTEWGPPPYSWGWSPGEEEADDLPGRVERLEKGFHEGVELLDKVKGTARRLEIAVYVLIAVTVGIGIGAGSVNPAEIVSTVVRFLGG